MNLLKHETSPYLLQHAANPVHWQPWGEAAFELARQTNKPVLLSIGYSSCHWCHVMAHESFENEEVAALMNQLYVNIKLDREEYPDIDHMYMDAVQAMTGSGGWPLNVFLTPDKKPFYGGTYFPPV
ncbi:MAG TPA: thioredoxin domain-containing protein, partial [Chitinophagaceae bacterium]|nr:thioredoxin domain-containing protein [Chitinophagaceae bacterium]